MAKKKFKDNVAEIDVRIRNSNREPTIHEMILSVLIEIHEELKELNTK